MDVCAGCRAAVELAAGEAVAQTRRPRVGVDVVGRHVAAVAARVRRHHDDDDDDDDDEYDAIWRAQSTAHASHDRRICAHLQRQRHARISTKPGLMLQQ